MGQACYDISKLQNLFQNQTFYLLQDKFEESATKGVFKLLQIEAGAANRGGCFNVQLNRISSSHISLWYNKAHNYCNVLKGNHNTYKSENNKCCSKFTVIIIFFLKFSCLV